MTPRVIPSFSLDFEPTECAADTGTVSVEDGTEMVVPVNAACVELEK